jgi:sec-independent protein translocase protein TatC
MALFKRRTKQERAEMSFVEHLEELRSHLFRSVVAIAIGAVVAGIYNRFLIKRILLGPTNDDFPTYGVICRIGRALNLGNALCMKGINLKMQSTEVSGQFSMWFTVVLVSGLILAFPYVFWQFWRFVRPALTFRCDLLGISTFFHRRFVRILCCCALRDQLLF